MQKQALSVKDFHDLTLRLDLLRYREMKVVFADAQGDIKRAFQGYDNMDVDLENLLGIRLALENKTLQSCAVLTPRLMDRVFESDDLAALRENVVREFGADIWPEGETLDFTHLVKILAATQEALAVREKTITGSISSLRWDFEEATERQRIEAVRQSGLVNIYSRLSATLVHLAENGAGPGSFAAVEVSPPLRSAGEYAFAQAELKRPVSLILPELRLHLDGNRPVLQ